MARIPEEEIEQIKRGISLERLVESSGVKLKRHGSNWIGLCPLHDDREPSLVVTPEKQLWHCLGACQAGGTVIDWVMRKERLDFRRAVEWLVERHPFLAADREPLRAGRVAPELEPAPPAPSADAAERASDPDGELKLTLDVHSSDVELMAGVVDFYHATLKKSLEALGYLEKRGIRNEELIDRFRLGFANRLLGPEVGPSQSRSGKLRERLQKLGVLRESGHEHLNGSLVIPIFDEAGNVSGMYGRKVGAHLRAGTPLHLYLPGPHRGVWNLDGLREQETVILCESLIDACTFWSAGFRNVTCSYGVEGFTKDHYLALAELDVERVMIAYDRDEAGDRAAKKLADELGENGLECFRVVFPKGMDANEYALKVRPAERSLGMALQHAEWMGGVRRERTSSARGELAASAQSGAPDEQPNQAAKREEDGAFEELEASELHADAAEHDATSLLGATVAPIDARESDRATAPRSREDAQASSRATPHRARAEVTESGDEVTFRFGDRRWRVRGLAGNSRAGVLRVNLLCSRESGEFHVDTLELYSARQRSAYLKEAATELGVEERVIKHDLGEVLRGVEEFVEKRGAEGAEEEKRELSDGEKKEALELLRDPHLLDRILEDFERCGVVGEHTNKLVGYLAATSRKLTEPLAVVIQSSSAAGKSSLMDAVLELMPKEERVQYSAMTGQSLFYMGETDLKHKILAIAEERGAERASYALKLLQSEGELTIASTGKDPATGRLITEEYHVEGPVMLFQTTTAVDMDEELLNRCIVLTVDEGREQTKAIHELQRRARTLEGVIAREERRHILTLHQNAQRLLKPLFVVNPYAGELRFPDHQTRTRRDHTKYLGLIEAVTLLHQYQRPERTAEQRGERFSYIEVTPADIQVANRLAHEVLGRSLDELPPQTRRLLGLLDEMVTAECRKLGLERRDFRFSRRQVRERTGWGDTQLRVHLGRMIELEYLLVHRGRQGQSYAYELAYSNKGEAGPLLPGLVDAHGLENASTTQTSRGLGTTSRGLSGHFAGVVRGLSGPNAGGVRGDETSEREPKTSANQDSDAQNEQKPRRGNGQSRGVVPLAVVAATALVQSVS